MPSQIGHNNPPKDRKINYKSVSLHKITVKDLTRCAEHITYVKNCFRLLNGKKPIKQVSIHYVIEIMLTQRITFSPLRSSRVLSWNILQHVISDMKEMVGLLAAYSS